MSKDKLLHFAACAFVALSATIAIAVSGATAHSASIAGLLCGMAIGIGKEYGDSRASGNKWDWCDIIADAVGAMVGAFVGGLITLIL